jgi:hypothetical protein
MKCITLEPHQNNHGDNLIITLTHNLFAIDYSKMGSGKTFTASYVLQYCRFKHCIVVCPTSDVWEDISNEYGLGINHIISYDSLRSRKGCQPKHGLLSRVETKDGPIFSVTPLLRHIIDEGCLVIFDESHLIKNDSDQFKAAKVLSRAITIPNGDCYSRVLFLSATPFDKKEQPTRLLQCAGVVSKDKLYNYDKSEMRYELTGIGELIDYCKLKNPAKTLEVIEGREFNNKNIPLIAYDLYTNIIQDAVAFCMPLPKIDVPLDCMNGYYRMLPHEEQEYSAAISRLNKALRPEGGEIKMGKDNLAAITLALRDKEYAKRGVYIRNPIWILENIPNSKVVISVNYNRSIDAIYHNLRKYNPLLYTGKVPKDKRTIIKNNFQQPDLEYRLLITNINVSSLSVSFDDRDGRFPRYAFGESGYKIMNDHQWTHRFYRVSTKSTPHIRFVYGNVRDETTGEECGLLETSIINAIVRKSEVMKDTLKIQVEEGVKFPADYEKYIEKEMVMKDLVIENIVEKVEKIDGIIEEIKNLIM